jgi:hypothetical protein
MDFIMNNIATIAGVGSGGILMVILKKIPNEKICKVVETFFFGLGKTATLGLSKWSWSKGVWNKTIEPYVVDLIDNVFGSIVRGIIKGLKSDND